MTRHSTDGGKTGHDHSHETIHHSSVLDGHGTATAAPPEGGKAKVCRMCGVNVAGHTRYKDGAGQYYCETCFNNPRDIVDPADAMPAPAPAKPKSSRKQAINCPECDRPVDEAGLVDFGGVKLCAKCAHQHELSAKREAARVAAAEQEALHQQKQRKMMMVVGVIVVGMLALYGLIRLMGN